MKMTIGKKIASIIAFMAVLVGISGTVGVINVGKVGKNADVIMDEANIIDSIQEARVSFQQLLMPPNDYLITGDEQERENFERLLRVTQSNLSRCAESVREHKHYTMHEMDDKISFAGVERDLTTIENLSRKILSMPDPLRRKGGNIMEEMDGAAYKVSKALDRLAALTRKLDNPELTDAIHGLSLSFHQLLMPATDYLITGDKGEIKKFDELLIEIRGKLVGASTLLAKYKDLIDHPGDKEILESVEKDLVRIEGLAREILSTPDPNRVEGSQKMEQMDAAGDKATEILYGLVKLAKESGRYDLADKVQRLRISFQKILMPANDYLIHGNKAEKENFEELLASAKEDLAAILKLAATEKEKEILDGINGDLTIIVSLSRGILSIPDPICIESSKKMEEMDTIADNVNKDLHLLLDSAQENIREAMKVADEIAVASKRFSIAALFVLVITGLGIGFLVSLPIINSIHALVIGTQKIGQGDLTYHVKVKTKDELLELSNSFNQMTDEIQKRNEELQTMNEELQSTNEELEVSNEELRSTTEELETSNEELQSTTEELEASNEELRTANEELEATQEKLIQQEKLAAVGQLASGVGHELRNPLGVIKNAAYYIKTKIGSGDPKLTKHLTIMEREINNSNRIISDLLGFSRTRLPSIVPSDVNEMVDNAMEAVEMPENVLLVKEFNPDLPKAAVDADQMHQVFVNLGLNAVQAMTEGGQLKVKTRLTDDYVEVEFSDTGCGIPKENLKKLFDPFFSTKARGVGLGLAVTHGIIERNKCTVEVKSRVSEGTTFIVKLPVEKQPLEKESPNNQKITIS